VFIPAAFPAQSKEDAVSSEEQKLHEGNGELVLLVDDEDGILDMAEAILKKHGTKSLPPTTA